MGNSLDAALWTHTNSTNSPAARGVKLRFSPFIAPHTSHPHTVAAGWLTGWLTG